MRTVLRRLVGGNAGPPGTPGSIQVKCVGATDRKEILKGQYTVCELRVQGKEWSAFHPGESLLPGL